MCQQPYVAEAYGRVAGVARATPNMVIGGGNDVEVSGQYYLFSRGWGDNPAGSIYSRWWLFSVAGNEVRLVQETDSLPGQSVANPGDSWIAPIVTGARDRVVAHDAVLSISATEGDDHAASLEEVLGEMRGLETLDLEGLLSNGPDHDTRAATADQALMLLGQ